jgi:hypothetical protein
MDAPKSENLLDHLSKTFQPVERDSSMRVLNVIKTPGFFCMMELPTELRLKVDYPSSIDSGWSKETDTQ